VGAIAETARSNNPNAADEPGNGGDVPKMAIAADLER